MMVDHSDLIHVDALQAVYIKYDRGREEHGRGEWVGSRGLVQAHDEVLDAIAYLIQERDAHDVDSDVVDALVRSLLDTLQGVRTAIFSIGDDRHQDEEGEARPPEELIR